MKCIFFFAIDIDSMSLLLRFGQDPKGTALL